MRAELAPVASRSAGNYALACATRSGATERRASTSGAAAIIGWTGDPGAGINWTKARSEKPNSASALSKSVVHAIC
jgi:hypothetical protein